MKRGLVCLTLFVIVLVCSINAEERRGKPGIKADDRKLVLGGNNITANVTNSTVNSTVAANDKTVAKKAAVTTSKTSKKIEPAKKDAKVNTQSIKVEEKKKQEKTNKAVVPIKKGKEVEKADNKVKKVEPVKNIPAKQLKQAKPAKSTKKEIKVKKEFTNSLGLKVKAGTLLKTFPYEITRCDQIAIVKGEYIPDQKDYTKRAKAVFVITAYYISAFKDEKADTLIHHAELAESKSFPVNLRGARGCLIMDGGKGNPKFTICTPSQLVADNLLDVFKKFMDCRAGAIHSGSIAKNKDNSKITKTTNEQAQKLFKSCSIFKGLSPAEVEKKLAELQKHPIHKEPAKTNHFFHPGEDKVPGS